MFKLLALISLLPISVYSVSLEPRSLDAGKILDYMLRIDKTVSRLSTKLEHTESELALAKKTIATTNKKSQDNSNRLNVVTGWYENLSAAVRRNAGSVAFEARLRNGLNNVGDKAIFKFDEVPLNKGGAYNPKTGIFTAPVTGTYLFWANIMANHNSRFHIQLIRDGVVLVNGYTARGVLYGIASIVYVCNVKKGQHVWFGNWKNGVTANVYNQVFSSYGGTLLTTL